MGECGCTSSDELYRLPAKGDSFYLIRVNGICTNCDAPAGITISLLEPGTFEHEFYSREGWHVKELTLEDWGDSKSALIQAGYRKHAFVEKLIPHLVGVSSKEMGENGLIDQYGAEVIAEEMYEDACFRPKLVR